MCKLELTKPKCMNRRVIFEAFDDVSSLKDIRNERRTHGTKQNSKGKEGKVSNRVRAQRDKQLQSKRGRKVLKFSHGERS